jgi:hypothetical protein
VALELRGGDGLAPPTRMGVLHSKHGTTLLRSCSSTSMNLRQRGLGHWTAKTPGALDGMAWFLKDRLAFVYSISAATR